MKRSDLLATTLLVPLDAMALFIGFTAAYALRDAGFLLTAGASGEAGLVRYGAGGALVMPYTEYIGIVLMIIPVLLVIFGLTGLYAVRGSLPWAKRLVRIFLGVSVGVAFILLLFLLRGEFFLPRSTVLYGWVLSILAVAAMRGGVWYIQRLLRRLGVGVMRLGLIGGKKSLARVVSSFKRTPHALYSVVWQHEAEAIPEIMAQLPKVTLDELIVVNEHYTVNELLTLRNYCLENHIRFSFVPSVFAVLSGNYAVKSELSMPAIEILPTPLDGWGRVAKRTFDILASVVLMVLFSPIALVVVIAMLLTDRGPILYGHERLGEHQKPIKVWKFRSMRWNYCSPHGDGAFQKYLDANPEAAKEWKAQGKLVKDPRVSAVGAFLRKTSLDELPQFLNVFLGQLSLVGPRPISRNGLHDEVEKYGEAARLLYTVKPGLTGLWQISGRSDVSFEERVAMDLAYIERWSLWWDIKIAIATAGVIAGRKGAA